MFFTYKNMRISFSVLIGISFIYFLLSCEWRERSIPLELARADSLILESPDSALVWLEQIEDLENFSRRDKALYYLLLTEAQDKAYRPHTTDSLIAISAGYFEETDDLRRKAKAWFYKGRVNQELNHPLLAQEYYLKALRDEERIDDHALFGRVNNNIGMLYTYQCVYEDALPYQKKAINHFRAISDSIGEAYALRDLGRTFLMLGHQDSAIFCDQTAICLLGSRIVPSAYTELANLYVEEQRLEEAYNLLRTALVHTSDSSERYPIYLVLGDLFRHWGKTDSACYYLRICADSATIPVTRAGGLYYLKEIAFERKEWEKNALLSKMYESLRDSLQEAYESETIQRNQALYSYTQVKQDLLKTQLYVFHLRVQYLVFAIGLLVILLGISLFFLRNKREKKILMRRLRENESYIRDYEKAIFNLSIQQERLRQEIYSHENNEEKLREEQEQLSRSKEELEQKLSVLNEENRMLHHWKDERENTLATLKKQQWYNHFHNPISWEPTKEDWEKLFLYVNQNNPLFAFAFQKVIHLLSGEEIKACYLSKIGVKPGAVSILLHQENISIYRKRIYEKLTGKRGSAKDLDRYIATLQ